MVEGDEQVIVAVVSQVNMVTNVKEWVVDFGATKHICANKESFSTYTPVEDGKEMVYLGDSRTAKVLGKGNIGSEWGAAYFQHKRKFNLCDFAKEIWD